MKNTLNQRAVGVRTLGAISITIAALTPSAALADVTFGAAPLTYGGGTSGLAFLPGTNVAMTGSMSPTTFTGSYRGDFPCAFTNSNLAGGAYSGFTVQGGVIPFNVTTLPVRISDVSLSANFKLAATGGNGVAGGGDPLVSLAITSRLYQLVSNTLNFNTDPVVPGTDLSSNYTQNGNGLTIVDTVVGPNSPNYILGPGNYYLFIQTRIDGSYPSTGPAVPSRGVTLEFGGTLTSSAYTGLNYTFNWQTVPTPGTGLLCGMSGMVMLARRRRN